MRSRIVAWCLTALGLWVVLCSLSCSVGVVSPGGLSPTPTDQTPTAPGGGTPTPSSSGLGEPTPGSNGGATPTPTTPGDGSATPTPVVTPVNPTTCSIYGTVVDALIPTRGIGNSYVYVPSVGRRSVSSRQSVVAGDYSDSAGNYELQGLPAGDVTIHVDPPPESGYMSIEIQTNLVAGQRMRLRITLLNGDVYSRIQSVVLSPSPATVSVGQTMQFTAQLVDTSGAVQNITPIWLVVGGLGTIDENGLFTAGSEPGQTTVVAVAGDTYTVPVTIVRPAFTVSPTSLSFRAIDTQKAVLITEDSGQLAWIVVESLTWLSVTPTQGTGGRSIAVTVNRQDASGNDLPPRLYTGQFEIQTNAGSQTVSVQMDVSLTIIDIQREGR